MIQALYQAHYREFCSLVAPAQAAFNAQGRACAIPILLPRFLLPRFGRLFTLALIREFGAT